VKRRAVLVILLSVGCASHAPDPCEVAWEEMDALRTAMTEQVGDAVQAPDRTTFLETCAALPEETRPCLSPRYALAHGECTYDWREAREPATRACSTGSAPSGES